MVNLLPVYRLINESGQVYRSMMDRLVHSISPGTLLGCGLFLLVVFLLWIGSDANIDEMHRMEQEHDDDSDLEGG